ncbi:MAG: MmcQ/YjbR family DNA-binding protein, partial [Bacteroidota bacterium]|nr:MmcQ/YjbR family DNA-binding protein [Bacteroidota bacterium]
MDIESIRDHCLAKPGVTESLPFDEETLVFKVGGKMFCLMALEKNPSRINLKCDPEEAISLRDTYPSIIPGYHMNKRYWNTVILDGSFEESLIWKMIDNSYDLVF